VSSANSASFKKEKKRRHLPNLSFYLRKDLCKQPLVNFFDDTTARTAPNDHASTNSQQAE
jgi:hypothetical protein